MADLLFPTLTTLGQPILYSSLILTISVCSEEVQFQVEGSYVWLDDLQTPTDQPFCVDRRADRANWEYKSLYRGDIAR